MYYTKKLIILLAMLIMIPVSYALAAEKLPIVIEADHLSYTDANGAIMADGNVVITNDKDKITAGKVQGNLKDNLVWVDDSAHLLQPGVDLKSTGIKYNYRQHSGNMQEARGVIEKQYVSGKNILLDPKEAQINDGTISGCDAEKPHYHVSAEKIEIWPGDKIVAYNAKLWIGDTVILSLPKYESSLIKDDTAVSQFPRVGYNSTNGLMIAQYFEYPISKNLAVYTDAIYYTQDGFKPVYGLVSKQSHFTAKLYKGEEQNGDHEWVKKEAQFDLQFKPYRVKNTSWTADLLIGTGKWTEGAITGQRQDYKLYFTKDPLKLSDKWTLKTGAGFERVNYGYNDSSNNILRLDFGFNGKLNERWEVWTNYAYNHQTGTSAYDYDQIDVAKELTTGFMYKYDKKNAVGIETIYNLETNKIKDLDYTWKHNMHCANAEITYRAKRSQVNFKVALGAW